MAVTNELKVGVMVVISALVLIGGIMFLKEIRGRSAVTHWKVGFLQVGGLSNGDPVLVQGGSVPLMNWNNSVVVKNPTTLPGVDPTFDASVDRSILDPNIFPLDVNVVVVGDCR